MQTAPHPHPESRSAAGRRKAGFPVSRGARGLALGLVGSFPQKTIGSGASPQGGAWAPRETPGPDSSRSHAAPAGPAQFERPAAAALAFDVTVPTMVLAPRAAAGAAEGRAGGRGPEAGREPAREPARGAGQAHAGARGSRENRRTEGARLNPGSKGAEWGRAERTAKPREGRAFRSPTSSRAAASCCACVRRGRCAFKVVRPCPGDFFL